MVHSVLYDDRISNMSCGDRVCNALCDDRVSDVPCDRVSDVSSDRISDLLWEKVSDVLRDSRIYFVLCYGRVHEDDVTDKINYSGTKFHNITDLNFVMKGDANEVTMDNSNEMTMDNRATSMELVNRGCVTTSHFANSMKGNAGRSSDECFDINGETKDFGVNTTIRKDMTFSKGMSPHVVEKSDYCNLDKEFHATSVRNIDLIDCKKFAMFAEYTSNSTEQKPFYYMCDYHDYCDTNGDSGIFKIKENKYSRDRCVIEIFVCCNLRYRFIHCSLEILHYLVLTQLWSCI